MMKSSRNKMTQIFNMKMSVNIHLDWKSDPNAATTSVHAQLNGWLYLFKNFIDDHQIFRIVKALTHAGHLTWLS